MRLVYAALILAVPILALADGVYTVGIGPGPLGHTVTSSSENPEIEVYLARLDRNGVTDATDIPTGFATPDVVWFGFDPTNDQVSSATFTITGTDAAGDTPFCPAGAYSDLTDSGDPASASCMESRVFAGAQRYDSDDANALNLDNDITVCALARHTLDADASVIAARRDNSGDFLGWHLFIDGSGRCSAYVDGSTGTATSIFSDDVDFSWVMCCGAFDISGNVVAYLNGQAAAGVDMSSIGTITSTSPLRIGTSGGGAYPYDGDIAAIWGWESLLSTANILKFTRHVMGIREDNDSAIYSTTNDGPTSCWVDGMLEEYGDDFMKIGCESPPGITSAGSYGGVITQVALINSNPYTRDLSSWTGVGTAPVSCAQAATPFRDGRTTCLVTDDDVTAVEGVAQALDITSLSTGSKITVCVAARSDSGTKGIDLMWEENTTCGSPTTRAFDSQALTTDWQMYTFTSAVADGTCTNIDLTIQPVSDAGDSMTDVAETGAMYMVVPQITLGAGNSVCPVGYSGETAGSAQNFGDETIIGAVVSPAVDGSGEFTGTTHFYATVTLPYDGFVNSNQLLVIDDGGSSDFVRLQYASTPTVSFDDTAVSSAQSSITSSALTMVAGTAYTIKASINYTTDTAELFVNDVSKGTDSGTWDSPTGVSQINFGASTFGTAQSQAGFFLKNIKITRN